MRVRAQSGLDREAPVGSPVALPAGLAEDLMGGGNGYLLSETGGLQISPHRRAAPGLWNRIQTTAVVPTMGGGAVVGLLCIFSLQPCGFDRRVVRALNLLGSMAAELEEQSLRRESEVRAVAELEQAASVSPREAEAIHALAGDLIGGGEVVPCLEEASERLGMRIWLYRHGAETQPELSVHRGESRVYCSTPVPGTENAELRGWASEGMSVAILARFADVVGLRLARERAEFETELRLTDDAVRQILEPQNGDLERIWYRAALVGIDARTPRTPVAFGGQDPLSRMALNSIAQAVAAINPAALLSLYQGDVVVLWPTAEEHGGSLTKYIDDVMAKLRPMVLTAGVGGRCTGPGDYAAAVKEALFARRLANGSSPEGRTVDITDLGMHRMLAQVTSVSTLRSFIDSTIGGLLEADRQHDSNLLHTVRVYLEKDRRITEAARELFVHVNTLRQRMERISKLLGVDFDSPNQRFSVHLAINLGVAIGMIDSWVPGQAGGSFKPAGRTSI